MSSREKAKNYLSMIHEFHGAEDEEATLKGLLDNLVDEQVEAIVSALTKELELYTTKDRMRHIVDICRDASLTKRGK